MATLAVPTLVPAPPEPKRGGILAVADVVDVAVPNFVLSKDVAQWPCTIPHRAPGLCWDDTPPSEVEDNLSLDVDEIYVRSIGGGTVNTTIGGDTLIGYYLTPSNSADTLAFAPAGATGVDPAVLNRIAVTPGDVVRAYAEFRSGGNSDTAPDRSHGLQFQIATYSSSGGGALETRNFTAAAGDPEDWHQVWAEMVIPDGVAEVIIQLRSTATGVDFTPVGFNADDWIEIHQPIITLNEVLPGTKEFDGSDWGEIFTFALYSGVECYLTPDDDFEARARLSLQTGESAAIEQALNSLLPAADASSPVAGSIVEAIAWAEQRSSVYVGLPTIWMNRYLATHAISERAAFPNLDWSLTTGQGSPILNGAFDAADTIWWGGKVTIWRGPVTVATADNLRQNRGRAVAERIYGVHIECGLQPIKITPVTP